LENAINEGAKLNPVKTEEKNTLPSQAIIDAEKAVSDGSGMSIGTKIERPK
jgi:hypothetical protein